MKFFLLGGGSGSRFQPWTLIINKCLIPVAGKPAARWNIEDIRTQDPLSELVVCINKKDEEAFRYELRDVQNVAFSVSEEPLGTVGELLIAKKLIVGTTILKYLDDLTEIDYKKLIEFHHKKNAIATIAVTSQFQLPVGVVAVGFGGPQNGLVVSFEEKPTLDKIIWIGVAALEPEAVAYFKFGEDIARDTIPRMINAGERVAAFVNDKPWYDVGNVDAWKKVDEIFRKTRRG